ncbi:unnamed protein product [Scytosiphon promiscuus]
MSGVIDIGGDESYLFSGSAGSEEYHDGAHTSDGSHSGTDSHSDHAAHEHHMTDFGIGTLVLAMTLGAASRIYFTHVTGLPYTVILLLLGVIFGLVLHEEVFGDMGVVGESLSRWAGVDSQIILFVFLPVLIFESAFETDVHIFRREFWQVVSLAGPGVAVATIMTASVVKFIFPYGWDWNLSLMLGGILSATDPVAVVALLKELGKFPGVSERLNVLIEGESLLNDATGIVVFIVFRDAYVGTAESSPSQVLTTAVRMALGGPLVGAVIGMFGSFLLGYIIDDAMTEITLTVIVCFSSFMISESTTLHVSGVLAAVTAGLVMSFYAGGRISPGVEHSMHTFWSMATYVANTVIFFVSGLVIGDRAIFDVKIGVRVWSPGCNVSSRVIRSIVVVLLLPVLTQWGYGMSYKQCLVLAFGGLRGDGSFENGNSFYDDIDDVVQSLVLFYVAGIAALTLVINGSLAGYLVSYLHLDRSTNAETEVFTKACSAIEARLEHKLDLLKGDRFLGDADWEIVWRYIPVSTAKMYWHRIRHGNVSLSDEEEEDIHIIRDGIIHKAGLQGELEFRAYQLRKWFTRRVLRLPGGVGYHELPSRLRTTWYTYHKKFHHSPSTGDDNQHRRDMELQRLNHEPRMMLEAEAWSNLNVAGDTSDVMHEPHKHTPASQTLRNHLDTVGMMGFEQESGMMSDLGQRLMATQAAGSKTLFGSGTRGGPEALRMVEGVNKLKEERSRARQAVAQAESRLARLKKDMGLVKGQGEEEEMKDYMKQASQGLILTTPSFRRGMGKKQSWSGCGCGAGARGPACQENKQRNCGAAKIGPKISSRNDPRNGGGDTDEEEGDGHAVKKKAKGGVATEWDPYEDSDDEDDDEKNPRVATGVRPMASKTPVVAGSTGEDRGQGKDLKTAAEIAPPGAVTMGSMAEARVRFLTAVKAHFTARYHKGWLSSMGLRVLKESMDAQLDYDDHEMDQWTHLSDSFQLPTQLASLRKIPVVGT